MNTFIQTGSILIAEGTRLPASIQTETNAYMQGWRLASNLDRRGLTQTISQAGWKLFYLATTLEMLVFGFNDLKAMQKAIKRITANVRSKSFNCLEIKQVETRRFLGFPCVFVSAHSWHIQENVALGSHKAVDPQFSTTSDCQTQDQRQKEMGIRPELTADESRTYSAAGAM